MVLDRAVRTLRHVLSARLLYTISLQTYVCWAYAWAMNEDVASWREGLREGATVRILDEQGNPVPNNGFSIKRDDLGHLVVTITIPNEALAGKLST